MDRILIQPHPLTNFEILRYNQNELKFKGTYSWNNLPDTLKDGAYVVNLDDYKSIETYWIALYVNGNIAKYFHSFGAEPIPKRIKTCNGK